ncbi:MAG: glycosyltransferase [Solirubrobacterales bacterium]
MAARISVTFITPHQRVTTGGVYAIHQFVRLAPDWIERRLVVAKGETTPIEGVEVLGPERLASLDLPPADLLVIPADFARAEELGALPIDRGMPVAFLQGFGTPGNPVVTANLGRVRHALAVSQWLVDAARRTGCPATLVRYGLDRDLFHPPADDGRHRRSANAVVAMMTHEIDWKGSDEGLAALRLARAALPELEIRLFGRGSAQIDGAQHLGAVTRTEVAELMRTADIFVCSSWEEGFGMPGLEAIECGAALATTDTLGSRDYALDGETALVTPRTTCRRWPTRSSAWRASRSCAAAWSPRGGATAPPSIWLGPRRPARSPTRWRRSRPAFPPVALRCAGRRRARPIRSPRPSPARPARSWSSDRRARAHPR